MEAHEVPKFNRCHPVRTQVPVKQIAWKYKGYLRMEGNIQFGKFFEPCEAASFNGGDPIVIKLSVSANHQLTTVEYRSRTQQTRRSCCQAPKNLHFQSTWSYCNSRSCAKQSIKAMHLNIRAGKAYHSPVKSDLTQTGILVRPFW